MANFIMNFTDADSPSFTIPEAAVNGPVSPSAIEAGSGNTSLKLYGKNAPTYGEKIEENLIHIMENFSGPAYPQNAVRGQLWFLVLTFYKDSDIPANDSGWFFWNGSSWSAINSSLITVGSDSVDTQIIPVGEFYYRTTDDSFYQYVNFDGTTPRWRQLNYTSAAGSPVSDTIKELRVCVDPTASNIDDRWASASGGAKSTVSTTAPFNPDIGDFWYNNSSSQFYVYSGSWIALLPDVSVYVKLDGSTTMTGPLTLSGLPIFNNHAASKQYVDLAVAGGIGTIDTNAVINVSTVAGADATQALNNLNSRIQVLETFNVQELNDLTDVSLTVAGSPPISSPTNGDLLRYNGVSWTNSSELVKKKVIAVMGDSLSRGPWSENWGNYLNRLIQETGAPYEVIVVGRGGLQVDSSYNPVYDDVNSEGQTYLNKTPTEQVIDIIKPDVLFYITGILDIVAGENPTIEFNKVEQNVIDAVQTALPDTKIILGGYNFHDDINFPAASSPQFPGLKYKGVFPWFIQHSTFGLGYPTNDPAELDTVINSTLYTRLTNYDSFKTLMKGLVGTKAIEFIEIDAWKVYRMGVSYADTLHDNVLGARLFAWDAYERLRLSSRIQSELPDLSLSHAGWGAATNALEAIFTEIFNPDGDGWELNGSSNISINHLSPYLDDVWASTEVWTLSQKEIRISYETVVDASLDEFIVEITHAYPSRSVKYKIWTDGSVIGSPPFPTTEPSSFDEMNFSRYGSAITSKFGSWRGRIDVSGLLPGNYKIKFLVSPDEIGPYDLTII